MKFNPGKVIFIGSSVCRGQGSPTDRSWSKILAEKLESKGYSCSNCSINGQNTADILLRLYRDVIDQKPEICIVGLSLANEGLHRTETPAEAENVRAVYDSNMRKIIAELQKNGIAVCCGGVYPQNKYNAFQYEILKKEDALSDSWGVPVFHWLDKLDDGQGHFREGTYFNSGHPNDTGYEIMAAAVPDIF